MSYLDWRDGCAALAAEGEVKIEIKHRFSGAILFAIEADSWRIAAEAAIKPGADLSGANLSSANLSGADLSGANLSSANLSGADLSGADLSGANLSRANLSGADLSGANLSRANISGADLSRADLYGADLSGAKNAAHAIAQTRILPEGDLIGYKAASCPGGSCVIKLRIPAEAKRSHAFGRKCRAEFVDVLEAPEGAYTNQHGPRTEYKVGERVTPDSWDENWQDECSHGIHFFITREEAEAWK